MSESSWLKRNEDDLTDPMRIPSMDATKDTSADQNSITPPPGLTLLHTLKGQAKNVYSVSWSPDGKLLASGTTDGMVWLWNPITGELLHTLKGHTRGVISVVWSPSGDLLASGSHDQTVRLWNPVTGKLLHTLEGHMNETRSVVWSPDGKSLASGAADQIVRLWNPITGELLHTLKGHTRGIWSVSWSPDGKLLASGASDGTVRLWNPITGQLLHTRKGLLREARFASDVSEVRSVVWSPDGKLLASGASDGTVRLWNPIIGKLLYTLEGHTSQITSMAWSPDGKLLTSGSLDQTVRLWNPITGKLLHTLEGHTGRVNFVVWSSDGEMLASGSDTGNPSYRIEVRIWRTDIWEPLAALTNLKGYSRTVWHPFHPLAVISGQRGEDVFIWHLDRERLLQEASREEAIHYANAKVVLVGDSGVGKSGLTLVLTGHPFAPTDSTHGRQVWLLDQQEVRQEGRLCETREILLWDLAGQPDYRIIHLLHLHEATVAIIVFDAARDTDPFAGIHRWHRALRQAQQARGSNALPLTIVLVAARIDRGGRSVSRVRINDLVQELGCAGYVETSAKDGRGIAELDQVIRVAIDWASLPKVTSTTLLQTIKTFVLSEQHAGRLLRTPYDLYDAFLRFPNAPIPSDELQQQFKIALGRLEAQGSIRSLGFGDLILLQPERLDAYASALLITVKDEPDGMGSIPEVHVQQGDFHVPKEYRLFNSMEEKLLLIAMIDELVRHQLVLRESGFLLFPSQSIREHPERSALEGQSIMTFIFAGPVLSIYTTLVVRLSQSGVFQKRDLWQNIVTYTTRLGGTYGLLLSPRGEERAELGLFFDEAVREEMRFHFEDFIFRHLEHNASGDVQRKRQLVCPSCGEAFTETQVSNRQAKGFTSIRCSTCDTEVSLPDGEERFATRPVSFVKSMEQAADRERERESTTVIRQGRVLVQETNKLQSQMASETAQPLHIYISSASTPEDELILDELEKQLSMLKRQPNTYLWEKRLISPGANWEQDIATYIHQAHLILFLVSPDFLASDHCYEEMKWAIKRREAREASVIPILIRHTASWQETPVGALEPLPADRKPVRDRTDREEAMRTIAEHIQEMTRNMRQSLTDGLQ